MKTGFIRRHPKILLLLLGLCLIICARYAFRSRPPDPSYNGRPLSEWLLLYGRSNGHLQSDAVSQEAAMAIRHIGTNALPLLLAWSDYEPPMLRYHLTTFAQKMPSWLQRSRPMQRLYTNLEADERSRYAVYAFAALGQTASPAIPELARRASRPRHPIPSIRRDHAMLALGYIGKPAVPTIAILLANPDNGENPWLYQCVEFVGTNAAPLVPAIVQNLQHTNAFIVGLNVALLGNLHVEPHLAIPALTKCLSDPRRDVRMEAPPALIRFGELARPALPALTNALSDSDPDVRRRAAQAIQRIAPETVDNTPAE